MRFKLLTLSALTSLLAAVLFAAMPVRAESVDDKIQALEDELGRLKAEQMELKKEATAAAAALPSFRYRRGFLGITSADKSWQISFSHEFHVHVYNHTDGNDARGFTTGDIFLRRNRPFIYYCWDDCLYEIGWGLDMDDGDIAASQHAKFFFNLDTINPYLPTIEISDRGNEQVSYVQRSSSTDAVMELTRDMLNDTGYDTLSHAAIGIGWDDVKIGMGDYFLWTEYRIGGFDQNDNADTDRRQFSLKVGARPFRHTKDKWLRGLKLGIGWVARSMDKRSDVLGRLALRTDDRIGRIRIMDAQDPGEDGGDHYALFPGLEWAIGPYLFRTEMARSHYDTGSASSYGGKDVEGFAWSLHHSLFVWSPKGFLTGSTRTPHSIRVGWTFKRSDMDCGTGNDCTPGDSTSSKGHLTKRELDVWYFLRDGLSVGLWWNWWDTPNMPTTLQEAVGCSNGNPSVGKSCDWHSVNLGLRANF